MADDIYVAKQGGAFEQDGRRFFIRPGQTARAGHPILDQHGDLFEPIRVDFEVTAAAEPKQARQEPPADKPAQPAAPRGPRK